VKSEKFEKVYSQVRGVFTQNQLTSAEAISVLEFVKYGIFEDSHNE
jgi:hypothetical protein